MNFTKSETSILKPVRMLERKTFLIYHISLLDSVNKVDILARTYELLYHCYDR